MKKVKLVKKALLPAVIAVFCSLVALTSVSYAWFTLGNDASIEGMDVNVQAAEGIQISADAKDWKSYLHVNDLNDEALTSNYFPTDDFLPMSSAGTVVDGKQQMYFGVVGTDGKELTTTLEEENDEKAYFIAFDLYVNLAVGKEFYLDSTSNVSLLDGKENKSHLAARVSFINLGTATSSDDALNLSSQVGDTIIWEPNSTTHISEVKQTGKLSYNGVNAEGTIANKDVTDTKLAAVTTFDLNSNDYRLFYLGAGFTKIRVYIWLEGQDADCLNVISGGGFTVNLAFEIKNCTNHTYTQGVCTQCGALEASSEPEQEEE